MSQLPNNPPNNIITVVNSDYQNVEYDSSVHLKELKKCSIQRVRKIFKEVSEYYQTALGCIDEENEQRIVDQDHINELYRELKVLQAVIDVAKDRIILSKPPNLRPPSGSESD